MSKRPTDQSVERAIAAVMEGLPDVADVGPLASFQKLSGGYANLVYEVNGRYILRVFFRRGWDANHGAERAALGMLASVPRVPRLLASGVLPLEWPCPYLLLSRFPGENAFGAWLGAPPDVRRAWAAQIASVLQAAHSVPLPAYGVLTGGDPAGTTRSGEASPSWQRLHDYKMADLLVSVRGRALDSETSRIVDDAEAYYAAHRHKLAREAGPRLVHGDVRLHNVIVDGPMDNLSNGPEVTGVIDWEWAHGGEPEEDLVNVARFCLFPEHEASGVRAGATRGEYAPLLRAVLSEYPELAGVPDLPARLTICLLGADLGQLCVNSEAIQRNSEERLAAWLDGGLLQGIVQGVAERKAAPALTNQ